MPTASFKRPRRRLAPLLAVLGVLAVPASATAAAETFHRFEAIATVNYTINKQCADGSTVQQFVTVIGGHEEEAESGVTTLDRDFLTVLIRGRGCGGTVVNDRGSGPAEFTLSPSLQEASVAGTITTRGGRAVTVDMRGKARPRWRPRAAPRPSPASRLGPAPSLKRDSPSVLG